MKKNTIKNFIKTKKQGVGTWGLSLMFALFTSALASAQVTLIDPAGNGGFETGVTFAANGWTAVNAPNNNRSWYIGTAQAGYTGARAAFIGNDNNTVGNATGAKTVHLYRSITIPAGAEDIQLTFKYKQAVADYSDPTYYDYIAVYLSNTTPTNGNLPAGTPVFGPFPEVSVPNFAQQMVALPASVAGTTTNLIFTFKADGVTPHAYGALDDVSLTYNLPACASPNGLAVSANAGDATLTWNAAASVPSGGYQFAVTPTSAPPATTGTTTSLTGNVGTLSPSTHYYAWVRSDCGGTFSTWRMVEFDTPCTASNVPYIEDFESVTVPDLPACTTNINAGAGNDWVTEFPDDYGFTTNVLMYEYDSDEDANAWFFTRGVNLTAGTSYRISYSYGTAGFDEKLSVHYGTAATVAGMATQLANHPAINDDTQATVNEVDFVPSTTGVYYFGFHAYSDADMFQLFVDDIMVDVSPSCIQPTNVTVNATANGATINWTAAIGTPAGYDFAVTPTDTPPATTTDTTGTSGSVSLLSPQTEYYAWVRSDCGSGDVSQWVMVEFMTPCDAVNIPYFEDFNSVNAPDLPGCSMIENAGAGNDWITEFPDDYGFDTNTLAYEYNSDEPANAWYFTRGLNLTGGTTYTLSYLYGTAGFEEKMDVYYGNASTVAAMTTQLADHPSILDDTAATPNSIDFTPATTGVYYIGFHAYSDADMFFLFVDDIMVDAAAGIDQFGMQGFSYHPNPVKDKLNLKYTSDITSVSVFDLLGQKVIEKEINATEAVLDIQPLADGAYIVNVNAGGNAKTIKIIKRQ